MHLTHELMLSQFRACLTLALRQARPDAQLLFWEQPVERDFATYYDNGRDVRIPVVPDAYIGLQDSLGRMYRFAEVTRPQ